MPLTNSDPHHWAPVPEIVNHLAEKYKGQRVLEIGPGHVPFSPAGAFVDFDAPRFGNVRDGPHIGKVWWQSAPEAEWKPFYKADLGKLPPAWKVEGKRFVECRHTLLPFEDKSWDFVYCRHVLEDMASPFHLLSEMSRVAKAGYIETPSPLCELTRGVDGNSPPYRGYNHHRWIAWEGGGKLNFISKFPFVEYLAFADEGATEQMLRASPRFWNTSYLWEGEIRFSHLQCPHDFAMPQEYGGVLVKAMVQAKSSTESFYRTVLNAP